MKIMKWLLIGIIIIYVGIVALFETWLGITQPRGDNSRTIVITTTDSSGESHDRVVTKIENEGQLYVAVNHWPRMWYWRILDNPAVKVKIEGVVGDFTAIELEGAEYDKINAVRPLPLTFRILTGFPPRRMLHLVPREPG
ncbi:MAG: nitroreductase/quinone reductase family protein [Pseudomonadota bacterium]